MFNRREVVNFTGVCISPTDNVVMVGLLFSSVNPGISGFSIWQLANGAVLIDTAIPNPLRDTMIAGIVLSHRASLATRNVRHFDDIEAPVAIEIAKCGTAMHRLARQQRRRGQPQPVPAGSLGDYRRTGRQPACAAAAAATG